MKKLFIAVALLFSAATWQAASAQIRFNVHLNIGSQPEWGPVGYDHVDYYYLPDVDAYYDVPTHQYVYYENNVWVHRAYLPVRYRNYDVYHGYKVVVNQPNPWLRHDYYRSNYARYRGRAAQPIIRESRDVRYQQHWRGDGNRGFEQHGNGNHHNEREQHDNGNHGDHGHGGGDRGHGHGRP